MSKNWMSDWEAEREDFEDRLQQTSIRTHAPEPILKEEVSPSTESGLKFGETQYGQLTLFPCIDGQHQKSKPQQENS